jgi:hypothetical protein
LEPTTSRPCAISIALGWPQAEDLDEYAAFALRGAVFALFPRHKLAHDAHAERAGSERGLVITAGYELHSGDKRVDPINDRTYAVTRQAGGLEGC